MSRYRFSFAAPLTVEACQFLEEELNIPYGHLDMSDWFCITAWRAADDQVVGVLACEPKTWFDWHFSCAIADQQLMTRRLLKTIFRTLFTRARRITALVEPGNQRALDQVRRMGFVYEGFIRCGVEGSRDVLMWGMLPEDCRFLPGYTGGTIRRTDLLGGSYGIQPQAT